MDQSWIIQGRAIGPEEVAQIRAWCQAHPDANRTRLSQELCRAWNWRNGTGRLKDMACRSLLLKLEVRGQIQLPPRRTASVNAWRNRQALPPAPDGPLLASPLAPVQPVRVQPVSAGSAEAALFHGLLQRDHYLSHRNCVGENLKYLARDRHDRPLACLLFGAAAWAVEGRDQWIGWNPERRRRHLHLVANNTRFLLLPWVHVPHLASHLLGQVTARLSADWQQKYGHPIYLVESFVEPLRFAGTSYRAAGWLRVGWTTGRTRNDDGQRPRVAPKVLYLKALRTDARRRLTQ